ncbi:glycosyltransferase [Flavobacterium sp. CYK-55]|uniref:glycosyltransferase family 2 protein n=1 Tax=Flavobacterium sp. CYK-55 TaxID=2835529 RepID=UPI001BD0FD90|nr:glycosyltransferase [Flavobacterium sp. CYK-55]MBS7786440.1 glycosyltransferase [Flavobacterium sp. CYK-55]
MVRLSIIIPAYKVEKFIEKSIRSLEHQDIPLSDYEIIVTNDGSPDNSAAIVTGLQQVYPNIILINQENQGVSMARNHAIAQAKGNYILPIDPDDYVLPNTFERILSLAEGRNLDVLYMGFEIFDADGNSEWKTRYSNFTDKIYPGVEAYFRARDYDVRDPDRSWAMLYKRSLLTQFSIDYPKGVPYLEDGLFLAKVFAVAERVGFDHEIFYQRTTRKGSATNSRLFYSEQAINGFILAIDDIKHFGKKNKLTHQQSDLIHHVMAKFVVLSLSPSIASRDFKSYFKVIQKLKQAGFSKLETNGLRFKYKQYIKVYNFSKWLFPVYFKLIN